MTQAHRISRRTFGAGLGLSVPTVLFGNRAASQAPDATPASEDASSPLGLSLVAVTPHDLLQMLLAMPFDEGSAILGVELEQTRWMGIGRTPYVTAVGGVMIQRAGADDISESSMLGGYGVYLRDEGAQSAMLLGERAQQDRTQSPYPVHIGRYEGKTIVYGRDPRVLTMIPVANVLVITNDILLDDGVRTNADAGIFRSVRYATVLLEHLERITSLQT